MTVKKLRVTIHILVWLLLLVIPYISTDQIFESVDSLSELHYPFLCLGLNALLLGAFYFNYYVLIPKFLFSKKKWLYSVTLMGLIIVISFVMCGIFVLTGFTPNTLNNANPIIEKVMPVIIINATALWFLSIMTSIIWVYYNRLKLIENEKLAAQITSLKSQINPHFLFNTLNNIYGIVIDSSPVAADMIDKLSEMMRYTMNDTRSDFVPLEDEINYINNYVELQRSRLDKSVKVEYIQPDIIPSLQIAPMLLIPFIENAFKYGVNSEQKSYIRIEFTINNSEFLMRVINNKVTTQHRISESHGLGISNTRSRLELIYPSNHLLVVDNSSKQYIVSLHLNLK